MPPNWRSDHRSILEILTAKNLIPAREAVTLGPQRVGYIGPRHHHVIELPDGAVAVHAGHGVVDIELAVNVLRGADAAPVFVELHRVDRLVFLGDLDLAGVD